MSALETFEWSCINCGEFHEYGQWKCYDLGWENQPRTCWDGYENSNSWNPPYHQYYGEQEHQPFVQEEPHQRQGSRGKKSLRELLEAYLTRDDENRKNQEAEIKDTSDTNKGLEIQLQKLSKESEEMFESFLVQQEIKGE